MLSGYAPVRVITIDDGHNEQVKTERGGPDYHDPLAGLGGAPPAQSALGLRLALAIFGLAMCVTGAVVLAVATDAIGLVVILSVGAVVALVDIVVVQRRRHADRHSAR